MAVSTQPCQSVLVGVLIGHAAVFGGNYAFTCTTTTTLTGVKVNAMNFDARLWCSRRYGRDMLTLTVNDQMYLGSGTPKSDTKQVR